MCPRLNHVVDPGHAVEVLVREELWLGLLVLEEPSPDDGAGRGRVPAGGGVALAVEQGEAGHAKHEVLECHMADQPPGDEAHEAHGGDEVEVVVDVLPEALQQRLVELQGGHGAGMGAFHSALAAAQCSPGCRGSRP